eukprot:scaffold27017_cov30-Prasinocladus_malaysianus.AAC.1
MSVGIREEADDGADLSKDVEVALVDVVLDVAHGYALQLGLQDVCVREAPHDEVQRLAQHDRLHLGGLGEKLLQVRGAVEERREHLGRDVDDVDVVDDVVPRLAHSGGQVPGRVQVPRKRCAHDAPHPLPGLVGLVVPGIVGPQHLPTGSIHRIFHDNGLRISPSSAKSRH